MEALSNDHKAFLDKKTSFSVALLDGVPDLSHDCFKNASISVDSSFIDQMNEESMFHGTSVASTLVGQGNETLGLCHNSALICIPVLDSKLLTNSLTIKIIDERLAIAIKLAVRLKVDVIQMSLEFNPNFNNGFRHLITAIHLAALKGIRVIVATGNMGRIGYNKVLASAGAVPVSTIGERQTDYSYINLGTAVGLRGFQAPGHKIPVAIPGDQYSYANGSSYAAAFITAGYLFIKQLLYATPHKAWDEIYESHLPERRHSLVPPSFNINKVCSYLTEKYLLSSDFKTNA